MILDEQLDRQYMREAIDQARLSNSEEGKNSPAVGVVLVKGQSIIGKAYRGEIRQGEHAEFTAIQHKLSQVSIEGATVYTTLEPCTTRNHPKIPCAMRLIESKVSEVVVGMLDPDPRIHNKGCDKLRAAGIKVRYFTPELRDDIKAINKPFLEKFIKSQKSRGKVSFDYGSNDGRFTIGQGEFLFETAWSKGSNTSIHLYNDPPSIDAIAVAKSATELTQVIDATIYDFSSRVRTLMEGQIAVLKNRHGYYAALKVLEIFDSTRPPDEHDELIFEYRILPDKGFDFSVAFTA